MKSPALIALSLLSTIAAAATPFNATFYCKDYKPYCFTSLKYCASESPCDQQRGVEAADGLLMIEDPAQNLILSWAAINVSSTTPAPNVTFMLWSEGLDRNIDYVIGTVDSHSPSWSLRSIIARHFPQLVQHNSNAHKD